MREGDVGDESLRRRGESPSSLYKFIKALPFDSVALHNVDRIPRIAATGLNKVFFFFFFTPRVPAGFIRGVR